MLLASLAMLNKTFSVIFKHRVDDWVDEITVFERFQRLRDELVKLCVK